MEKTFLREDTERALDTAARYGKDVEFEALQYIAVAWSLRCQIIGIGFDERHEFYLWYIDRLIMLQDKVFKEIQRLDNLDPSYQLKKRGFKWEMKATLAKIRAVLDSLPEVERATSSAELA